MTPTERRKEANYRRGSRKNGPHGFKESCFSCVHFRDDYKHYRHCLKLISQVGYSMICDHFEAMDSEPIYRKKKEDAAPWFRAINKGLGRCPESRSKN